MLQPYLSCSWRSCRQVLRLSGCLKPCMRGAAAAWHHSGGEAGHKAALGLLGAALDCLEDENEEVCCGFLPFCPPLTQVDLPGVCKLVAKEVWQGGWKGKSRSAAAIRRLVCLRVAPCVESRGVGA
jgi:hypothetical protein